MSSQKRMAWGGFVIYFNSQDLSLTCVGKMRTMLYDYTLGVLYPDIQGTMSLILDLCSWVR